GLPGRPAYAHGSPGARPAGPGCLGPDPAAAEATSGRGGDPGVRSLGLSGGARADLERPGLVVGTPGPGRRDPAGLRGPDGTRHTASRARGRKDARGRADVAVAPGMAGAPPPPAPRG